MQVPYEYHRSQTLASKFALLTLTQRRFIVFVDSSVGYFANAQYDVFFLLSLSYQAKIKKYK